MSEIKFKSIKKRRPIRRRNSSSDEEKSNNSHGEEEDVDYKEKLAETMELQKLRKEANFSDQRF